jgi:hypothetical protein
MDLGDMQRRKPCPIDWKAAVEVERKEKPSYNIRELR